MAKIVKHCAACEENFSEKFGFCPNCAAPLTTYEMNPLTGKAIVGATGNVEAKTSAPPALDENPSSVEKTNVPVTQAFSTNGNTRETVENESLPKDDVPTVYPASAGGIFGQNFYTDTPKENGNGASNDYQKTETDYQTTKDNGLYHITFVEEKNASGRNLLLLGSFLLVTTLALGGIIWSLYESNPYIGSLNGNDLLSFVGSVEETPPLEEEPPRKNPDKGGGGGGGGKENPDPVNKGRLPNQVEKPIMPPQPMDQVTNPSLPNPNETQGNIKRPRTDEPVGRLDGSSDKLSSGGGFGGGMGEGRGTGAGSGIGTGEGSGIGSGSGSGRGNGNGDGTGDGDNAPTIPKPKPKAAEPKPQPVGVTTGVNIISRPRPPYTDAARQNQVTGVVRLRVTFLASGQIGGVAAVSGLPNGLTEQAISAARSIRFEPAKRNGVPYTVTKQVEYSFTLY